MAYIQFTVSIHGLKENSKESRILERITEILIAEFGLQDVEIKIEEHAGIICETQHE